MPVGVGAPPSPALDAGAVAWLAVVPCAIVVVLAIVVLGPPLGRVLFSSKPAIFWTGVRIHREPTEHARYALALVAPLLLAAAIGFSARRPVRIPSSIAAVLVGGTQVLGVLFLVVCFVVQRGYRFHYPAVRHVVYFRTATLIAAGVIAAAIVWGVRNERVRARFAAWTHDTRGRTVAAVVVAVLLVAISLLPAINFDHTLESVSRAAFDQIPFTFDEVFAVLDGRSPLVNFAAQYGSLWPYVFAGLMTLFGTWSVGALTVLYASTTGLSLLAVFAVLRRVVRSSVAGLLLFGPVLATCLFTMRGPPENRYSLANLFGAFPLRYAGPLLLFWLTARQLDGARPRRAWPLFLLAGLVVLNNVEFGIPALAATVVALVAAQGDRLTRAALARLALHAAGGLVSALALVSALTLARASSLPQLSLLVRFARLFGVSGFGMLPIHPVIGVSTVVFLTFVAAIATATVRVRQSASDRLLTGLLAWSGVFGLGAGSYYVGRSHPEVLINLFPAWSLSVALLLVVVLRRAVAQPARRPGPAEVACALAFGVLVCSLAQTPKPWSQIERLQRSGTPFVQFDEAFVLEETHKGEAVALLTQLGHRVGARLGLNDVTPYTGASSMPTVEQLDETLRLLRREGGRTVFFRPEFGYPPMRGALERRGFRIVARSDTTHTLEYVQDAAAKP